MNYIFRNFYHIFMEVLILCPLAKLTIIVVSASPQYIIFVNKIKIGWISRMCNIVLRNI